MRERNLLEIEILAARWAFLAADQAEDWEVADREYERMNALLDEYVHIPRQRTAS